MHRARRATVAPWRSGSAWRSAVPPARRRRRCPWASSSQTVATKTSRAQLSEFLVGAGAEGGQGARLGAARSRSTRRSSSRAAPASAEAQAARDAVDARRPERATPPRRGATYAARRRRPERARRRARRGRRGSAAAPDPFADKLVARRARPREAKQAFALGRAAFAAKQYGDALVYFHMGYALAPELPGFLRELGSTYDKLGAAEPKREFYRRYLVQRPFGANADVVRAELAKDKDVLGTLLVVVEPAVHRAVGEPPADHRQAPRQGHRRRARQLQGTLLQPEVRDGAVRVRHRRGRASRRR